jgi:uncharacterized protein with von Willebrand factor type A (vWA) domain
MTMAETIKSIQVLKEGRDETRAVPKWDRYMAGAEAASGGSFGTALAEHERSSKWASYAREMFSKLYDSGVTKADLKPEDRPLGSEWVENLHQQAEGLPEWRSLQDRARRDPWACGVAAGEALRVIAQTVKPPEADPQSIQDQIDMVRELGGSTPEQLKLLADLQQQRQAALEEMSRSMHTAGAKNAAIRSAFRGAAMKAHEQLDEMDGAMMALGAGDNPGVMSRVSAPPAEVRNALAKNAKLRRILKIAGRMKAAAIQKQRDKVSHGQEELCDIKPGSDLNRLVPSELANLASEDTEALLYSKLIEGSALTYELRGREHRSEGPIIIAVDESGSMSGAPDEWAKSIALALMEIAARQGRQFAYVHFDTRVSRVDEVREPRKFSIKQIEELATYFTGGGTIIGNALDHCAGMLEGAANTRLADGAKPWKRADIILVTDGLSGDVALQNAAIDRIRKLGGHLYSFFVGFDGSSDPCATRADEKLSFSHDQVRAADPSKLGTIFSI